MKKTLLISLLALFLSSTNAYAHCEIPCGIYDDSARFTEMMEHAQTIEKSMTAINQLSEKSKVDYHAIVRWTTNKEEHAKKVQDIAAQYFLTQRVLIPAAESSDDQNQEYKKHTTLLHQILVKAMKTKQTTDTSAVHNLRNAISAYKDHYFVEHGHQH